MPGPTAVPSWSSWMMTRRCLHRPRDSLRMRIRNSRPSLARDTGEAPVSSQDLKHCLADVRIEDAVHAFAGCSSIAAAGSLP